MASLAEVSEDFERHIVLAGIIDPDGVHQEFGQGLHGQKADFDKIHDDDPLFAAWRELTVRFIQENYDQQPDALVGVANGTNRLAEPVAEQLGAVFLETEKLEKSQPTLTPAACQLVEEFKPVFALIIEDVGTVGTNSLSAAQSTLSAGVRHAEVLDTLQRSPRLPLLDEAGIVYQAIIKRMMPSYTPEECQKHGFCAAGWELIPYGD
jgi:hypothetical protein